MKNLKTRRVRSLTLEKKNREILSNIGKNKNIPKAAQQHQSANSQPLFPVEICLQSNHAKSIGSCLITKVKQCWLQLVFK